VGIDRAHLRRLRRGEVRPELTVDLHGLTLRDARREVRTALARALSEGKRCVMVVHGRGLHSEQGPVLKKRLVRWLGEPPHGGRVMAFASAPARRGGGGATYVLLRRRR
jgi:DNA-nicking Smr family endonuclease